MTGYTELSKLITFNVNDVISLTGNINTAKSMINRLQKKQLVKKIRNGLYSCVNLATGEIIANKYQLASAITKNSYVAFHSALEYYGYANQNYYVMYVASESKFNNFEFDNIHYKYVHSKSQLGVDFAKNIENVLISNLERTIIDSIFKFEKIGGLEELVKSLEMITKLDEKKLVLYLEIYNSKFLYQKSGYLLTTYTQVNLSSAFVGLCLERSRGSVRYLENNTTGTLNKEWNLIIANNHIKGEIIDYI